MSLKAPVLATYPTPPPTFTSEEVTKFNQSFTSLLRTCGTVLQSFRFYRENERKASRYVSRKGVSANQRAVTKKFNMYTSCVAKTSVNYLWTHTILWFPYWSTDLIKLILDKEDSISGWITLAQMSFQYGSHLPQPPETSIILNLSEIYRRALLMAEDAESRLENASDEEVRECKELRYPDKMREAIYRILYNLLPVFERVEIARDELNGGTIKKKYEEYQKQLKEILDEIKRLLSRNESNSGGGIVTFATRMMESFGVKAPEGMNTPTDADINGMLNDKILGNPGIKSAIGTVFAKLPGCTSVTDVLNLVGQQISSPEFANAFGGSMDPSMMEAVKQVSDATIKLGHEVGPIIERTAKNAGMPSAQPGGSEGNPFTPSPSTIPTVITGNQTPPTTNTTVSTPAKSTVVPGSGFLPDGI